MVVLKRAGLDVALAQDFKGERGDHCAGHGGDTRNIVENGFATDGKLVFTGLFSGGGSVDDKVDAAVVDEVNSVAAARWIGKA